MNLSRAYSLTFNEELSVGRVQTPTLAMLVEREIAIRNFVVEEYLEVHATFGGEAQGRQPAASSSAVSKEKYRAVWFRSKEGKRARVDGVEARRSSSGPYGQGVGRLINSTCSAPPFLYD